MGLRTDTVQPGEEIEEKEEGEGSHSTLCNRNYVIEIVVW